MTQYVLRRLLFLPVVLLGVTLITFLLLELIPGDPASVMLGDEFDARMAAELERTYGLDKPLPVRYVKFLASAVRLDFGRSIKSGNEITPVLLGRFAFTFQLSLLSLIISIVIGIFAGVIAATKQYSIFDNISMVGSLLGISTPIFVTGLLLILIFAVVLPRQPWWPDWLKPAAGRFVRYDGTVRGLLRLWVEQPKEVIKHLALPALALGIESAGIIARMTRASMLEVIRQDYIRTHRAYGIAERVITYKHALKNALIPVVTVIGLQFGINLGGAVLTETVFALPGMGRYIVEQGILSRDYPIVQAGIVFVAFVFVVVNLITDLSYALLDPRIRYH